MAEPQKSPADPVEEPVPTSAVVEPRAGLRLRAEVERETDGRWLAEVPELPGVMAYGDTREAALAKCTRLAADVLADREAHGERVA